MQVFVDGCGQFINILESTAFGTDPDFMGSQIGQLRLRMNQLLLEVTDQGTDMEYDLSFDVMRGCQADINQDGVVNVTDLLEVLSNWGQCIGQFPCCIDFNDDNQVDVIELIEVISAWGSCDE